METLEELLEKDLTHVAAVAEPTSSRPWAARTF